MDPIDRNTRELKAARMTLVLLGMVRLLEHDCNCIEFLISPVFLMTCFSAEWIQDLDISQTSWQVADQNL